MIQTACAICGSYKNYTIVYKANFRKVNLNKKAFSARRLPDSIHYQIVRCQKDNLVRSNPILEPSKIATFYKQSKFTYGQETNNLERTYLKVLDPVLRKLNHKDNILEIGCGNGFILKRLWQMGYKNCFGIEPSKESVNKADKSIKKNIVNNILKVGLFKTRFKFIFFFQTLDHIPDPGNFLKLCYKLLDKDGHIIAFNHDVESFSSKFLGEKSPIIDIEHTFLYSSQTIKKLFKKYQFKPIKVYSPANIVSVKHLIWLLPLPKMIKKTLISYNVLNEINLGLKLGNLCIIAVKKRENYYAN